MGQENTPAPSPPLFGSNPRPFRDFPPATPLEPLQTSPDRPIQTPFSPVAASPRSRPAECNYIERARTAQIESFSGLNAQPPPTQTLTAIRLFSFQTPIRLLGMGNRSSSHPKWVILPSRIPTLDELICKTDQIDLGDLDWCVA